MEVLNSAGPAKGKTQIKKRKTVGRHPAFCDICHRGLADKTSVRKHKMRFHQQPEPEPPVNHPNPDPELPELPEPALEPVLRRSARTVAIKEKIMQQKNDIEEQKRICDDDHARQKVTVKDAEGKGQGVFATKLIPIHSPVCEYKGTHMPRKEAKYVEQPYVFDFDHKNKAISIDATEHLGTIGRYINHSRDLPNIVPRKVMFIGDDRPHLIFFALRDIVAEEEIVYEYGDYSRKSHDRDSWLGPPRLKAASKARKNIPS